MSIYIYIYIGSLQVDFRVEQEAIHEIGLSGNVVASFFPLIIFIYIYIFFFVCVCVCVCVSQFC